MTIKSGRLELGEDDVKLKAVKTLYHQLIDSKLQNQVSDIERRKQEFMVDFRQRLALKMLKKKEIQQIKKNSKIVMMGA
jgi:signal recognition particle GTPase